MGVAELLMGEALDILATRSSCCVDAIVTDPPSGTNMIIPFRESSDNTRYVDYDSPLGKLRYNFKTQHNVGMRLRAEFQKNVWPVLAEASRLLKPGGYGVFWGLQKSSHWLSWGLEEAGLCVTDLLVRETGPRQLKSPWVDECKSTQVLQETELWVLARKPGELTASKTFDKWGTAYLNIVEDGRTLTHLFRRRPLSRRETEHPNEKPVEWMRALVRLVTPSRGIVLDPFMGSGSTGVAAILEGHNFIGVERDPRWFELAQQRIQPATPLPRVPPVPGLDDILAQLED